MMRLHGTEVDISWLTNEELAKKYGRSSVTTSLVNSYFIKSHCNGLLTCLVSDVELDWSAHQL